MTEFMQDKTQEKWKWNTSDKHGLKREEKCKLFVLGKEMDRRGGNIRTSLLSCKWKKGRGCCHKMRDRSEKKREQGRGLLRGSCFPSLLLYTQVSLRGKRETGMTGCPTGVTLTGGACLESWFPFFSQGSKEKREEEEEAEEEKEGQT